MYLIFWLVILGFGVCLFCHGLDWQYDWQIFTGLFLMAFAVAIATIILLYSLFGSQQVCMNLILT